MRNNVTEIYFNGQEMTTILIHWQHDYKQILKFSDIDLPFAYEVDFANAGDTQSKTMIGNADGVEIPDEYLMTGKAINAYIYMHDASDSGETVRKVSIQVHGRPERTEEIPEPHQQSVIDQAIAALDAAVEQTASDVQTTGEYKEEAHGYADDAKTYAERAEAAVEDVSEYATRAETAAGQAEGYATTASEKASEASGYATEAKGYSESASSFASDAQASANASYENARSSAQYASDASGYASSAYESAQSASGSASDASSAKDDAVQAKADAISAKNDAVQAKNDSVSAKNDAVSAKNDAVSAKNSAEGFASDASGSADLAEGYANDAQTSAEQAQESAEYVETALIDKADIITSSASGEIVTIQDGGNDLPVVDLSVSLLPIQDLHGQDAPYPAGGGKNLFPYPVSKDETVANVRFVSDGNGKITITGTASQNGFCNFALVNSFVIPDGQSYKVCFLNSEAKGYVEFYNGSTKIDQWGMNAVNRASNYTLMSGSNCDSIRFFVSSGVAYNMTLQIMFVANSYATTAYIPYSNVCLISGWTGVEVDQAKKNLLEPKFYSGIVYNPNVGASAVTTLTDVTNTVTKEGNTYSKTGSEWDVPMSMVLPLTDAFVGKTLKFSGTINEISGSRCAWIITDSEYITKRKATIMSTKPTWSITIQKGDAYLIWYMNSSSAGTYTLTEPQIEVGSTATAYEPYNGNTYPISWQSEAGTVYGGSLDVTSGVLTVNLSAINANSISWVKPSTQNNANGTIFTCDNVTVPFIGWASVDFSKTLSNAFVHAERNANTAGSANNTFWWNNASTGYRVIWGSPNGASSYDDFIAFLTNNNVMFVGELASPQTFQLSETQIATFLGNNSFWSNGSGVVDLEYRCDTKLYIENLTKPTEDDMTANANIASGKFFTVGNRLFLSSVAIGQGETIIPGTNCSEISLADALNQINS